MNSIWEKSLPGWDSNISCTQLDGTHHHCLRRAPGKKPRFADNNQAFVFGCVESELALRHPSGDVKQTVDTKS